MQIRLDSEVVYHGVTGLVQGRIAWGKNGGSRVLLRVPAGEYPKKSVVTSSRHSSTMLVAAREKELEPVSQ